MWPFAAKTSLILAGETLDAYHRLRGLLTHHQNAACKTISRGLLRSSAKMFGMLEGNKLLLESDSELTILMDFCIYSRHQKGKTVVEKYLAKLPPTDDADEKMVREAMAHPRFSMYRAEKVIRGSGLHVRDVGSPGTELEFAL